jgi:hypothetical protein
MLASSGGSVVITLMAGCICGPQVGSIVRAGGAGMVMVGLSRLPRWPLPPLHCCTMPNPGQLPKQKPLAAIAGGLALAVVMGHWLHGPR